LPDQWKTHPLPDLAADKASAVEIIYDIDARGFFQTGNIATMGDDGYIRL